MADFRGKPSDTREMLSHENYVTIAESNIHLYGRSITTTKLRNILAMTLDIFIDVEKRNEEEKKDFLQQLKERIQYFRIRCLYDVAKDAKKSTENQDHFIMKAGIIEYLENINKLSTLEEVKEAFTVFTRYMEALVAFNAYNYGMK